MFGWFRRKKTSPADVGIAGIIDLPNAKYANVIAGMFGSAIPAEAAMTVVAINYLRPMTQAMRDVMARDGKRFDEEDTLRQLLAKDMSHPISGRRLWWYASGYLVRRLDRLAVADPSLGSSASQVWAHLIEGAQFVPKLLENNVVWSPDEKRLTLELMSRDGKSAPTARDAMLYVLRHLMPEAYQGTPEVAVVRERHNLTLFGP